MSNREAINRDIDELPDELLEEVRTYVEFLKARAQQKEPETAIASEPVLARDWLRPEEDEAWADL